MRPTSGAAQAATPPSKDRSKEYMVDRSGSGVTSAMIAELQGPHLQAHVQLLTVLWGRLQVHHLLRCESSRTPGPATAVQHVPKS